MSGHIGLSNILGLGYSDEGYDTFFFTFLNSCRTFIISHCDMFNMRHSEHNLNVVLKLTNSKILFLGLYHIPPQMSNADKLFDMIP